MAEQENILNNDIQQSNPSQPSIGNKIKASVKEWARKQVVMLKRAPQRIPLVYMVIVTAIWLIWLFTFSQAVDSMQEGVEWIGISVFVITLFSILALPLFLSAFPKREKPNLVFIGTLLVFLVAIILFDILYYHQVTVFFAAQDDTFFAGKDFLRQSASLAIAHIVLNAISIILIATLPLYKKLIMRINTKKVLEENKLSEEIDTSAEV